MRTAAHILDDLLPAGLRAVICGTAAGNTSAARSAYYAGPSNRFWGVLQQVGLTPYKLAPENFRTLPKFGLGLTDIAKAVAGADATIQRGDYDVPNFAASIRRCSPEIVAFNGKKAASVFYGIPTGELRYGMGADTPGFPRTFVLPSTSGAAAKHWDVKWWEDFARLVLNDRQS